MRPLEHLGFGQDSPDYDLYTKNEKLYDTLLERSNKILKEAFTEFMGPYAEEPRPTKAQLEKKLDRRLQEKNKILEYKNSGDLLKLLNEDIVEIYNSIQNKDYAKVSDPVYQKYVAARNRKLDQWYESEVDKVCKPIFEYNEAEYNKIK